MASTTTSPAPDGAGLVDALQRGGLVVVFRHGATDRSQPDAEPVDLTDCSTQRNLTATGRRQSAAVGEAFHRLTIPVGPVWASPYCRSRETAELGFGAVEIVDGLERFFPERDDDADRMISDRITEQAPSEGEPNLVIVGHGEYASVLAPAVTLAEGEAAIYAVGDGEVTLLGRALPDNWEEMAETGGDRPEGLAGTTDTALDSVVAVIVDGEPAGTGFRVAIPRIVVTAASLLGDTESVEVILRHGSRQEARVIGTSSTADIGAIFVDDTDIPPMHSRDGLADARPGDAALAVTPADGPSPLRWSTLASVEPSTGEVLADGGTADDSTIGAPLVDSSGDVLGVVTTVSGARLTAVPVDVARDAVMDIVDAG